jgi:hypothetical protein
MSTIHFAALCRICQPDLKCGEYRRIVPHCAPSANQTWNAANIAALRRIVPHFAALSTFFII